MTSEFKRYAAVLAHRILTSCAAKPLYTGRAHCTRLEAAAAAEAAFLEVQELLGMEMPADAQGADSGANHDKAGSETGQRT